MDLDAAVYNVLLLHEQSVQGARQLMQSMQERGVAPNERTFRWEYSTLCLRALLNISAIALCTQHRGHVAEIPEPGD